MLKSFAMLCLVALGAGCAMSESVSDDQSAVSGNGSAASGGAADVTGPGGAASGGAAGAAGASNGGAAGEAPRASGGAAGEGSGGGAAGSPPSCSADEKLCEAGCAAITPEVGCGSLACVPCQTPPVNSKAICNGALCDFECLPGFTQQGFACVSTQGGGGSGGSGSGGTGGTSGAGGTGGGASLCVAPCTPSDAQAQLLCAAACALKGGFGLCAPALNCCVCG